MALDAYRPTEDASPTWQSLDAVIRPEDPQPEGWYALDFNMAFIPPCAHNPSWSCPSTPRENRVTAPIRAGERGLGLAAKDHGTASEAQEES